MNLRFAFLALALVCGALSARSNEPLSLEWKDKMLTVRGGLLREPLKIWYLEAYCRPGSTDREWDQTVIPHRSHLVSASEDGRRLEIRDTLQDGVVVHHLLEAGEDEVRFELRAHNPTGKESLAHWAQPCMRVDAFTGAGNQDFHSEIPEYARKCFVFLNGKLTRLPTQPWATRARYLPGQVWIGPGVPADDVNPRPVSTLRPGNGLIGCFSADESLVIATAWQPWQELFLGIIGCIHSDFRIGGLKPGESKTIRGRLYVMKADIPVLLQRYQKDLVGGE